MKSLTDHWSIGASGDAKKSSFENIDLAMSAAPGIEYNLFPYSQYTRRQLRVNYFIGPYYARYVEETLFFQTAETLTQQRASVQLEQVEPRGSLEVEFQASNYLPGFARHRLEFEGEVDVRIARGSRCRLRGAPAACAISCRSRIAARPPKRCCSTCGGCGAATNTA